ncbi:MAG: hypothetical protein K2O39_02955 [Clostridiales bacterium]|nr:hypothetical protein [Clostridiales bacterium]
MEHIDNVKEPNKSVVITEKDFQEFLSATGEEQFRILLSHAERNKKIIQLRRIKNMNEQYNDHHYEEISKQFEEFCHTKGIAAKFKVAFAQMAENTRKQKEADKAQLEEVKRQSAEANPEFTELLHTKGFKAKVQLIIANLKKGIKEAPHKTAAAVDGISAQTKANIAKAQASVYRTTAGYGAVGGTKVTDASEYSADDLAREFNEFLKAKGLDGKYAVEVTGDESTD